MIYAKMSGRQPRCTILADILYMYLHIIVYMIQLHARERPSSTELETTTIEKNIYINKCIYLVESFLKIKIL